MEIVLLLIFFPKLVLAPIFLTRKFHFQNWHKKLAYINIKTKWFLNYKQMDRVLKSCLAFLPLFCKSPMDQWPVRKTRQNMRANRYMRQQVLKKLQRLDSNLGYLAQHRLFNTFTTTGIYRSRGANVAMVRSAPLTAKRIHTVLTMKDVESALNQL